MAIAQPVDPTEPVDPENPKTSYPLIDDYEKGALLKLLQDYQKRAMAGDKAAGGQGGLGFLKKLWQLAVRAFSSGNASQVADIKAQILSVKTAVDAATATGKVASFASNPLVQAGVQAGLAGIDTAYQNKQANKDRSAALSLAQVNEIDNAERARIARAQLKINQGQDERDAMAYNYAAALKGALAQNMQDVSVDRSQFNANVPTISFAGGLRPSALGETAVSAGRALQDRALAALQHPAPPEELPAIERLAVLPGYQIPNGGTAAPRSARQRATLRMA